MNKKLQVFVSSTYTDLIEERQAAVQAILDAGHIPAGMELFKAGNRSQLDTIYKWIDESDIFMLILGGRYGSIDSQSGKSYTQLEYEYATNIDIPVFSVILSKKFLHQKAALQDEEKIFEQNNIAQYKKFKSLVMSKLVREVENIDKISIAIHTALLDFQNDTTLNLIGWLKGTHMQNSNTIDIDLANVLIENRVLLKEKINNTSTIETLKKENDIKTSMLEHLKKENNELRLRIDDLKSLLDAHDIPYFHNEVPSFLRGGYSIMDKFETYMNRNSKT